MVIKKCWVGTPSYRKWDCIDYETIDNNLNSNYGKHGVIRETAKGYVINNGSYEIIKKIATSGIMGTENWKESCWTDDPVNRKKFKNFALENTEDNQQKYYTTITEINNNFDNKIYKSTGHGDTNNPNLGIFTTNMYVNNVTSNTVFDPSKNNIFGINILGRQYQYPWIHLDCKYGNEKPDIDKHFIIDTENNLNKNNNRYYQMKDVMANIHMLEEVCIILILMEKMLIDIKVLIFQKIKTL